MANTAFQILTGTYQMQGNGSLAVDQVQGYPITLSSYNGAVTIKIKVIEQRYAQIKEDLQAQLKSAGVKGITYRKGILSISLVKRKKVVEQYEAVCQAIQTYLSPYVQEITCPYCGQYHCDSLAVKDNLFQPMHQECFQQHMQQVKNELARENHKLSEYLQGAAGAIVGGIIPMIIAAILIFATKTSFGWLYFLCASIASVGYQKMRGPVGKWALLIVSLSSVMAFFLFLYGYNIIELSRNFHFLSLANKIQLITQFLFSSDFFETYWFEALFFLLGLVLNVFSGPFSKKRSMKEHEQLAQLLVEMNAVTTQ